MSVTGDAITGSNVIAQRFTTGNHSNGYDLTGLTVNILTGSSTREPAFGIYTSTNGSRPDVKVYGFDGSVSSSGKVNFSAPVGAALKPDTDYFLYFAGGDGTGSFELRHGLGPERGFDTALSLPGWSIARSKLASSNSGGSWSSRTSFLPRHRLFGVPRSTPLTNFIASGKLVITGTFEAGEILTADVSGILDQDGISSFNYQWVRVDGGTETNITGAVGSTYALGFDDVGTSFKVIVFFTDDENNAEGPFVSDATDEVEAVFGSPWGVWSDGVTLWVVDDDDDELYAYTLANGSRDSGKDIGLAAGNDNPRGVWSDGETVWVVQLENPSGDKVYAYSLSSGDRRSGREFNTVSSSGPYFYNPRGLWSDNETFWVANWYADAGSRIHAFKTSDKSRDSGKDFTVSHEDIAGIWSDGNSMWVAEEDGNRVYGYRMSDMGRDSDRDFRLSSGNVKARGMWSDGAVVYLSDDGDDERLYSYLLADVLGPYVYGVDVSYVGRTTADVDVVVYKPGEASDVYLRYRLDGSSGNWTNSSMGVSSRNVQFSLNGLDSSVTYDLEVSLHDDFRNGATTTLEFVTLVDSPPSFSSGDFSVDESSGLFVGLVEADDPDVGDSVTGYGVAGGDDAALFSITSGGVLSFNSAPDFENPGDLNQDNEYVLVVNATSGSGGRSVSANQTITVTVNDVDESVNSPPVFSSSSTFPVDENTRNVGTVVASDSNAQDSITGYDVSGGADSALFTIGSGGILRFRSAPDFETVVDANGDNEYMVVVEATSGSGSRERTATQRIMVTVVDVDEAPSRPSAPSVSGASTSSLLVSWSAPSNTGPFISDYDVEFRQGTSGSFSSWSHAGNSTSTTITGLSVNTLYEVQVLARNAEGDSVWSLSGSGRTRSTVTPPTNNPPVFTSSSSFSVQENSVSVDTVVADDADALDDVTGYVVSGGVDSGRFSITSGGVLSFVSAPDFERPSDAGTDNGYVLVVEATSGSGSRERTATQRITVTVSDVIEVPSAPSAPVLSSPSSTSLFVSWSAPLNTGPVIGGYDVQYKKSTDGSFGSWSHSGNGTSATITGLSVNTLYEVQVLARNAEGDSVWSLSGGGRTRSTVTPPTNNDPVFTSSPVFPVNENSVSVGIVAASDGDGQDSVTGYRVSGGVDASLFDVTNSGVLSFKSAPDFETPLDSDTDNDYLVVVEVTSGTGARVRTATQSITVTVNDVDEGGPVDPPREVILVYTCG